MSPDTNKGRGFKMTDETNVDEVPVEKDELTLLKERADMMKIKYHPAIGAKSLKEKIDEQLSGGEKPTEDEPEVAKGEETILERNARLRKEANQLVRIQLTCMNPMKRNWNGDFFEVSNSVIGTIKKYVPFNVGDAGWHVPTVILKMLRRKKYQTFYDVQKGRHKVKKSKLVPEFGITVLDPLTEDELKDLAQVQAASHSID